MKGVGTTTRRTSLREFQGVLDWRQKDPRQGLIPSTRSQKADPAGGSPLSRQVFRGRSWARSSPKHSGRLRGIVAVVALLIACAQVQAAPFRVGFPLQLLLWRETGPPTWRDIRPL